jgi:hypothetical protein
MWGVEELRVAVPDSLKPARMAHDKIPTTLSGVTQKNYRRIQVELGTGR